MRTLRIVVLAAGLLVLGAMPVAAGPAPFDFTISPVGGTPGTNINVTGHCPGTDGDAYLLQIPRSDVAYPPADHRHFTIANNNFSTTLQNPFGNDNQGFPTDLNVRVQCGAASASKPFQASNTPIGVTPAVFVSQGATPCQFGNLAPPADSRIPCPPHVKGFNAAGALSQTNMYVPSEGTSGVSIAIGDVTNDGQVDVVTGSGAGDATARITKLDGTDQDSWQPYPGFTGGVNVAVGDVTGDGRLDVVTGAGPGGGPHVLVFSRDVSNAWVPVASFYAYDPSFSGGVNVAVGNGHIVTGAGPGGGPHVKIFDGNGAELGGFYAYDPAFRGGVNVAAGNGMIVTGAGAGGGPHVRTFSAMGALTNGGWYAYDPAFTGGVPVAIGRVAGAYQIVTGAGPGGGPHVRIFNTSGTLNNSGWYAFAQCCRAGIRAVAVTP